MHAVELTRGLAIAVGVALAGPVAPARAFPVTSGELDQAWANVFDPLATDTNRTWLGYATGPAPANANGTVSPILPGSGPTVSLSSARGPDRVYTWRQPAAVVGGDYDPATRTGTLEFTGGIRFEAPPFPAGHAFTITVENPRVVLDGAGGQLFASGTRSDGEPYGRSSAIYDLDLSTAKYTDTGTSTTISGIVPRIATEGYVYPPTYAKGAGPDHTPNTFGTFTIVASAIPLFSGASAAPSPAAPPRASALRLTRKGIRFALSRPVQTRVQLNRRRFTVPATSRSVSQRLKLEAGRYRVTLTPAGGDPLTRRFVLSRPRRS